MSDYLDELDELLHPANRTPPHELVAAFRRAHDQIRAALQNLDNRLTPFEARLLIVDDLPADAPFGALIRLRGDLTGSLYTGNGPGRPLGKLTPTQV